MAAEIIQENILLGQGIHNVKLLFQQTHIPGGNRMPGGGHGGDIIQHMALRLLHRTEIRHHLLRLHHHFSQQQNSGADNLGNHTHHTHNRMYLL